MARSTFLTVPLLLALLGYGECEDAAAPGTPEATGPWGDVLPADDPTGLGEGSLCLAVRGNGPRATAHFSSIARIYEHYGLLDGVAGGSSGSVTTFFVTSAQSNPYLGDGVDAAVRAAFLFKSLHGFLEVLATTDEASAGQTLAAVSKRIQEEGVEGMLESNPAGAVLALRSILESDDLRDLINPEAIELLQSSPNPVRHAQDMVEIAKAGVAFNAEDPRIFITPGLIDFDSFVDRLGRVGGYLAGDAPVHPAAMGDLLDACAAPSVGLDWNAIRDLPANAGATCGERFDDLVKEYLSALEADPASSNRVFERIGDRMPAMAITAVLDGPASDAWRTARTAYLADDAWTLDVDFNDVRVGYWGAPEHLERLSANPRAYTDLRTAKTTTLGTSTWAEILAASPAEPGLSRGVELADGRVSVGGWPDPVPALALKNIGCDNVILLTREGRASTFITAVAALLGQTDEDASGLWDLDNPSSSFVAALEESDGVWCTNWDAPEMMDLPAMFTSGYDAPMESVDEDLTGAANPYANISDDLGTIGCSLGADFDDGADEPAPPAELPGCATAAQLRCGQSVVGDTAGADATTELGSYGLNVGDYSAPEVSYGFVAETSGEVTFRLVDPTPTEVDHDVFVLDATAGICTADTAIAWGFHSVTFEATAGSRYVLVVDGYHADAGEFEAAVECD